MVFFFFFAKQRYVFRFECMKNDCKSRAMVRKIVGVGATLVVLQQTCGANAALFHVKSVFGGFGLTAEVEGYSDDRVSAITQSILTIVLVVQVRRLKIKTKITRLSTRAKAENSHK